MAAWLLGVAAEVGPLEWLELVLSRDTCLDLHHT